MSPPALLRTDRLILRRWHPADAVAFGKALDASSDHLRAWIPPAVGAPAPLHVLRERLARFVVSFDEHREWLYGIFPVDAMAVLGQVGLYPRTATSRVPFAEADRLEIGYWLHRDATGQGFATEAARAMLESAQALDGVSRVEIRCDPLNERSSLVPRRLGFQHVRTEVDAENGGATMVWEWRIAPW